MGDINDYLYLTTGNLFPEDNTHSFVSTRKGRDVYGMGMIIYEASFHRPGSTLSLTFF